MLQLAAERTTPLILEDDADWDVELRPLMPLIAHAVRNLTDTTFTTPYGTDWDVLWLGHCGDNVNFNRPLFSFYDPILPIDINSWDQAVTSSPEKTRWVHWSMEPICTYTYAVTGASAKMILDSDDHSLELFDI